MNRSIYSLFTRLSVIFLFVGLIFAFAGFFSYITRYANLDSLDGTIDEAVYEQITQIFTVEKVFLIGGTILTIAGVIGLALSLAGRSRAPKIIV